MRTLLKLSILILALSRTAAADRPDQVRFTVEDGGVFPAGTLDYAFTVEADILVQFFFDSGGNLTSRILHFLSQSATHENLDTMEVLTETVHFNSIRGPRDASQSTPGRRPSPPTRLPTTSPSAPPSAAPRSSSPDNS